MNKHFLAAAAAALTLAFANGSALAQSANLYDWKAAGDVLIDSPTSAQLTTAAVDSGEMPISLKSALLFDELEPALSLPVGSLAPDTFEGSGLQQSFVALAGSTVSFSWSLSTLGFDGTQVDRAFVIVDGSTLSPLGAAAGSLVSGNFSHTFGSAGNHALAIVVMDVDTADRMSTLTISNFNVSAVPEPTSALLLLAGLAGLGLRARQRHSR